MVFLIMSDIINNSNRQLIIDTETTGLDPKRGERIIEFAALEMVDRKLTGNSLHLYINPEKIISNEASKIHGIYNKDVINAPKFIDIVAQIIEFITDAELIIHNAKFDISFLDYQFIEHGYQPVQNYVKNVIDTLTIARQKYPGTKNSLDALCDRFNVDRSNRDYHGALIDCQLLSHVYLNLTIEQISLLPEKKTINDSNKINIANYKFLNTQHIDLVKNLKVVPATLDELNAHELYMQQITQSK